MRRRWLFNSRVVRDDIDRHLPLAHELRNHTVKGATFVTKSSFASALSLNHLKRHNKTQNVSTTSIAFCSSDLEMSQSDRPIDRLTNCRKFSAVSGTTSARNSNSMRPTSSPPTSMSKKTVGYEKKANVRFYLFLGQSCGYHRWE